MISFIIIGRNEGWKITNCIQNIFNTIEYCRLNKYEIIYIDSDSTDNSVERAKAFGIVKVFGLTGDMNAAIARNVGAKEAVGDVFFFIDGDMEIIKEFLPIVYSETNGLIENFVSGHWVNYYNSHSDELINRETHEAIDKDQIETTTGGLFLINKNVWNLVGGMKIKFKIGEDHDLGLRLAKLGIYLLRKKELAAIHHTIAYLDDKRIWQDFFKWNHIYQRSFLYRQHIFNKHIYKRIFRSDYTMILLIISIVCAFFLKKYTFILFLFYLLLIAFRSKFKLRNAIYFIFRDLSVFLGFFIFFPKKRIFSFERKI